MLHIGDLIQETFARSVSIAMTAIFVENILFTRALGVSATLFVLRKDHDRRLFCLVLTFISAVSCCLAALYSKALGRLSFGYYLRLPAYVLTVGLVYIAVLLITSKLPARHAGRLKPMIHLAAFNSAIIGGLLLAGSRTYDFWGYLAFGLGTGIGYAIASYLMSLGYERLQSDRIPEAFRGFPAMLIYTGILSLAFYGLIGHGLSV
ncbi:MAG: hypothetical protein HFE45_11400 [Oscillospiraceae bacterium]|jgi:electron transport complex protein RnfA|nr:hypothetical protein [Oscillospiraceae bacterium]